MDIRLLEEIYDFVSSVDCVSGGATLACKVKAELSQARTMQRYKIADSLTDAGRVFNEEVAAWRNSRRSDEAIERSVNGLVAQLRNSLGEIKLLT